MFYRRLFDEGRRRPDIIDRIVRETNDKKTAEHLTRIMAVIQSRNDRMRRLERIVAILLGVLIGVLLSHVLLGVARIVADSIAR